MLALGGAESTATDRISATLIGAAVGMGVNLAFPPSTRARSAAEAVQGLALEIVELLESASRELDRAVEQAELSRRLNVGSLGVPNPQESLRGGLEALEHTSVAVALR